MTTTLNWGILATGSIARTFARFLPASRTGKLVAVASRTQAAADKFGAEFNIPAAGRHGSYEALLSDPGVQAVYIATPHPQHALWAIRAAEAGKHILCEKPLTLNHATAMAVVEAARAHHVFLMEAFMYRCHPQTAKLVELLRAKAIGEVRVIQATFSFHGGTPDSRLLANDLGGGGILDVGCYCASMARLVAGVAAEDGGRSPDSARPTGSASPTHSGGGSAEPLDVKAVGRLGSAGTDEWSSAVLRFPGDIIANLATGVQVEQESVLRIYGSEGSIFVPTPWVPAREGGQTRIILTRKGKPPEEIIIDSPQPLYAIEADTVAANLEKKQAPFPAMSWDDTLGNMQTLDRWRQAIGLVYESEKPAGQLLPVDGRPLRLAAEPAIPRGQVPGVEKSVSRLIMGVDNQRTLPHAAVMFDAFFAQGGNAFDTAHVYGGGVPETLLGQWIRGRGVREQVVVIGKGGHTPNCLPDRAAAQLRESLERAQLEYFDLYLLHRDNPEVPVGEFIDWLNAEKQAGRIRGFGCSNWTLERVKKANAYVKRKGLSGMAVVSNNFSLARMVNPVWAGCLSATDAEWRAFLKRTQTPLLAWSSQARGFFTDRAGPDKCEDQELVHSWYSEDNFRRRVRVYELAAKRGVKPIQIALAYVLRQPLPIFPLIGPRTLAEFRESLPALKVELSPRELKWLNLEV